MVNLCMANVTQIRIIFVRIFNKFYSLFKIFKKLVEEGILDIDKKLNEDKAFPRGFSPD